MSKLLDESYKSLKNFTKNNDMTDSELKELDEFIKLIDQKLIEINSKKDKNFIVNLGKAFKYLIEREDKDDN
jgi:hypothetical protein